MPLLEIQCRSTKHFLVIAITFFLVSCGVPSKNDVRDDLVSALKLEIGSVKSIVVTDMQPGEGDSDNVYFVADLAITTDKDILVNRGELSGLHLRQMQPVKLKRVNVLYQRANDGKWRFVGYSLSDKRLGSHR